MKKLLSLLLLLFVSLSVFSQSLIITNEYVRIEKASGKVNTIALPLLEVTQEGSYVSVTGRDGGSYRLLYSDYGYASATALNNVLVNKLTTSSGLTKSAFGEQVVVSPEAYIQAAPVYGLVPANFRQYTSGTGTTGIDSNMFVVNTGVGVGGYGAIQSFRAINYKAGQGGRANFTARFTNGGVASSWQGVGLVNLSDELSFGYSGTDFGVWHRYGGVAEVRTITVTGASGGSTNLTLTLNDVAYTIPLTSGTVQKNAAEIADWLNDNQSVWGADQIDDDVIISALSDGAKSGTYSFSHATATGSIAQNKAGVTKTSTHIPQADWNVNTLSNWVTPLDPTKGNVYQIKWQYLGFGIIEFYVEDREIGSFVLVHTIKYPNTNLTPSLTNPSLRLGMYAVSLGSTTDIKVYSGSMAGFVEGQRVNTRNPRAVKQTQSVSTSFTNVLTLRNRRTYNYRINQVEVSPLLLIISSESSQNVEVEIRGNATFSAENNFQSAGNNLVTDVDVTSLTVSGGTLLAAATLGSKGNLVIDLNALEIRLPPTLQLTISAKVVSGASANVTATLTYYEDL